MSSVPTHKSNVPSAEVVREALAPYRATIDDLDRQIVDLLMRRLAIIQDVASLKATQGIPAILPDRVAQVIDNAARMAQPEHADHLRDLYTRIVDYACTLEERLIRF